MSEMDADDGGLRDTIQTLQVAADVALQRAENCLNCIDVLINESRIGVSANGDELKTCLGLGNPASSVSSILGSFFNVTSKPHL